MPANTVNTQPDGGTPTGTDKLLGWRAAGATMTLSATALAAWILGSPALTGTPTAPTAAPGTNTTQVATTAFVTTAIAGGYTDEQAQDAVGAMLNASLTYDDGTPLLHLASRDYGDFTCSSNGTVCDVDTGAITGTEILDGTILGADIQAGAVTSSNIAGNGVADVDLRDSAALSVIGRAANSSGDPADITCSAGSGHVLRESGSTLGCGTITTGAVSGLAGSTYTPTLTGVANVSSSTASECQYLRVAASVSVSCKIEVTPTSAETPTRLGVSLPVASNIGADSDCAGSGATGGTAEPPAFLSGDATNDRCQLEFTDDGSASRTLWVTFIYQVI